MQPRLEQGRNGAVGTLELQGLNWTFGALQATVLILNWTFGALQATVLVLNWTFGALQATVLVLTSWDWDWEWPRLRFAHHRRHLDGCSTPSTAQSAPRAG
jgi:hypothetical protein